MHIGMCIYIEDLQERDSSRLSQGIQALAKYFTESQPDICRTNIIYVYLLD